MFHHLKRAAFITRQILADARFKQHVLREWRCPVGGQMPGFHAVIGELHHVLRAGPVTLLHIVAVDAERPVAVHRTPQHFGTRARVHGFQITRVDLTVEVAAQMLEVVRLHVVNVIVVFNIFTHAGTHARQRRIVFRVGVAELVVVIRQVHKHAACRQQMVGQPQIGGAHQAELVHVEVFRAADGLVQHRVYRKVKARLLDIPALLRVFCLNRRHALLHQLGFMAERLAFEMVLKARHVGFRRHLRHVQPRFGHPDAVHAFRQVVHDDAVGALDAFARVAIFILLAGHIERVAFDLNLRVVKPGVIFQRGELIGHHAVLQHRILRLRIIFRATAIVIRRAQIVKVGAQRKAEHHRVAALVAQINVRPVGDAVDSADVELALLIDFAREVLGVVVAFILQLQAQRLPRGLVFDAAENRGRAVEHRAAVDRARALVARVAIAEFVVILAERVFHVAVGAEIAPAEPE
ncbi:hypothetical protein BN133_2774 [Cronobacter dublinensis 582]|nr:hypothetical protein BN133_2774 [Cronobacter dublinensis 582]